jgi:putative tricarboxylic transport membrane protein
VSRRIELAGGAIFFLLGLGVCVEASRLGFGSVNAPQPGFFPWIGGVLLTGLSISLLVWALCGGPSAGSLQGNWRHPALLVAVLAVYVPLLEPVGYPLTTAALCVVVLRILKTRRWSVTLGVSVVLALGTYLLFRRGLGVELPPGVLWY